MMENELKDAVRRLEAVAAALTEPQRPREYLSVPEAADFLTLSRIQLDEWRCRGGGPAYCKVGRRVIYSVADLRAFAEANRSEPLS